MSDTKISTQALLKEAGLRDEFSLARAGMLQTALERQQVELDSLRLENERLRAAVLAVATPRPGQADLAGAKRPGSEGWDAGDSICREGDSL